MARTREDHFEDIIRKAAEIEIDEGNPRELFDRIGLRPFIQEVKDRMHFTEVHDLLSGPIGTVEIVAEVDSDYRA